MAPLTKATLFEAMLRLLPPLCFTAALLCSCGTPDAASSAAPETETAAASQVPDRLDIHGHRGARGLLPENTIPGLSWHCAREPMCSKWTCASLPTGRSSCLTNLG